MEDISIVLEHTFQYQEPVWHNRELPHPYINQYYTTSCISSRLMLNTLMELLHQSCFFLSTHVFVLFYLLSWNPRQTSLGLLHLLYKTN